MANQFKIWGYGDNRADADKGTGKRRPCVSVYRSNPWEPESVDFTPRQARLAAAAMVRAADAGKNSTRQFV